MHVVKIAELRKEKKWNQWEVDQSDEIKKKLTKQLDSYEKLSCIYPLDWIL